MEQIPTDILILVFNEIPLPCLVHTIHRVCWRWNRLLAIPSFWWKRLTYENVSITKDYRNHLTRNIDDYKIVKLLKATCCLYRCPGRVSNSFVERNMWFITKDNVTKACSYIILCKPSYVLIEMDSESIHNLFEFLQLQIQLNYTHPKIEWRLMLNNWC